MNNGRLEQWQEIDWFGQTRMAGKIYELGHDDVDDGDTWITNAIVNYDTIMGQLVVYTRSGSCYYLGEPAIEDKTTAQFIDQMTDELRAKRDKKGMD